MTHDETMTDGLSSSSIARQWCRELWLDGFWMIWDAAEYDLRVLMLRKLCNDVIIAKSAMELMIVVDWGSLGISLSAGLNRGISGDLVSNPCQEDNEGNPWDSSTSSWCQPETFQFVRNISTLVMLRSLASLSSIQWPQETNIETLSQPNFNSKNNRSPHLALRRLLGEANYKYQCEAFVNMGRPALHCFPVMIARDSVAVLLVEDGLQPIGMAWQQARWAFSFQPVSAVAHQWGVFPSFACR
jgi:hypothetical protein